jgi:oligopeptidase B
MNIFWIILGGSLGALSRYGISLWLVKYTPGIAWLPTLSVNLLGCLGLGICFAMFRNNSGFNDSARLLWMVGFFGSFTTFSTFALDVFAMLESKMFYHAAAYVSASLLLGVGFFGLGCKLQSPSTLERSTMTPSLTQFGITRTDPHAWIRDKTNPEVIELLKAENQKTDAYFKAFEPLENELYEEMISRINEDDQSHPYPMGQYLYYSKINKGDDYPAYYRKKPDGSGEQLLLDLNDIGKKEKFLNLGSMAISPSEKKLAYTMDFNGSEIYTLFIRDIQTGKIIESSIHDSTGSLEWGKDDDHLYYMKMDDIHRPYQLWLHTVGQSTEHDQMLYQDDNLAHYVGIDKSRSKRFIFIHTGSKVSSEVSYIDLEQNHQDVTLFAPLKENVLIDVDHHEEHFVIHTNENAIDFKVLITPIAQKDPEHWQEVFAHQKGRYIESVSIFQHHWVLWLRENGSQGLRIFDPKTRKQTAIPFTEKAYDLSGEANHSYDTDEYRYGYSSMKTPYTTLSYHVKTGQITTLKQKQVPGPFNPDDYEVDKIFAPSRDGQTQIPISILKPKDLKRDGQNKVLLYGYGSYGISVDPGFNVPALSLVDRGYIYAIAHPRGSTVNGRSWYEDGKFLNKKNTFNDFIDCGQYLIEQKYTQKKQIAIMGGSAGGLLMGAAINQAPDMWGAVLALVPFVDVINTMLDESLPLTITEYDEWGSPKEEKFFRYMHSYAPYENIQEAHFPPILATGGINDPRVGFWEPTKWVLRLREHQKSNHPILLKMEMGAGHQGPSGRYNYYKERAGQYAFAMHAMASHP